MILALLLMAAEAPWTCDDPQVQQAMNWCAGQDHIRADAALNAQWAKTTAVLKRRDSEREGRDEGAGDKSPGDFETLLAAQRAWLTFRSRHCAGEGYAARGGSMQPMLINGCKARLAKERTRQLRELAEL